MRWVKHMTHANTDEKMALLIAELGLEGYGFYWLVLETVARQIEAGSEKTSVEYPVSFWRKITGFSPKKLRVFAEFCTEFKIFSAKIVGNAMVVDIPNILKYRDEWSKKKAKNSGETPESLRSKDTDTDTDIYFCADPRAESTPDQPESGQAVEQESRKESEQQTVPPEDVAGTIPLAGGKAWVVTKSYVAMLAETYPGVEPAHEFKKLKLWLDANPSRMSATVSGAKRRVTSWFQRAQDNGGRRGYAQ